MSEEIIKIKATQNFPPWNGSKSISIFKGSEKEVSKDDWDKGEFWTTTDDERNSPFGTCSQEGWEVVRYTKEEKQMVQDKQNFIAWLKVKKMYNEIASHYVMQFGHDVWVAAGKPSK